MQYFHRTSLSLDGVLAEADRFFGTRLAPAPSAPRARVFTGTIGRVRIAVRAEGGHYTLVTVDTDQLGESEADTLAKRFLGAVHARVEPGHAVRGAY